MEKKFLGISVGQWIGGFFHIVILAYLIGVNHQILRSHSESIKLHSEEIKNIQKTVASINENGSIALRHQNAVMEALTIRVNKTETAITKIEVLSNDFQWLKDWLRTGKHISQ